MPTLETFFLILFIIQIGHSTEKLSTGFHKKFPLFKMKFRTFLGIEIAWFFFWISVLLYPDFPYRHEWMALYTLIVWGFGVGELAWWTLTKKYVPGLVGACLYIPVFIVFYFKIVF